MQEKDLLMERQENYKTQQNITSFPRIYKRVFTDLSFLSL